MFKKSKVFLLLVLTLGMMGLSPSFAKAAQHAIGSNIITPQGTVFTISVENDVTVRRPYTSPGAFLSFGFNSWESIVGASAEDLALPVGSFIAPQDGKIICSDRGVDRGTCYLISDGKKAGFTSAEVFRSLGFDFGRTSNGDVSFLPNTGNIDSPSQAHVPGTIISLDGVNYLVTGNGLLRVPSLEVLRSWGYSEVDVTAGNSADKGLARLGDLVSREARYLTPLRRPIDGTLPPIRVPSMIITSPIEGDTLYGGETAQIIWDARNTTEDFISNIYLYEKSAGTWYNTSQPIAKVKTTNGVNTYTWNVPTDLLRATITERVFQLVITKEPAVCQLSLVPCLDPSLSARSGSFKVKPRQVGAPYFSFETANLPSGKVATSYTANIYFSYRTTGTNYATNVKFSNLPPGITTGNPNNPTSVIGVLPGIDGPNGLAHVQLVGTPNIAGSYSVTMSLDDQYGVTAQKTYPINIDKSGAIDPLLRVGQVVSVGEGTVYLVSEKGLLGFPTVAVFTSWGFCFQDVVKANSSEEALSVTNIMPLKTPGMVIPSWIPPIRPSVCIVVAKPSLTVALDGSTPISQTVQAGTANVTFTNIVLYATGGDVNLGQISIGSDGSNGATLIKNIRLFDGTTEVGYVQSLSNVSADGVGRWGTVQFSGGRVIPNNSAKRLTIKADIVGAVSGTLRLGVVGVAFNPGNEATVTLPNNLFGNPITITYSVDETVLELSKIPLSSNTLQIGVANQAVLKYKVANKTNNIVGLNLISLHIPNTTVNTSDIKNVSWVSNGVVLGGQVLTNNFNSIAGSYQIGTLGGPTAMVNVPAGGFIEITVMVDVANTAIGGKTADFDVFGYTQGYVGGPTQPVGKYVKILDVGGYIQNTVTINKAVSSVGSVVAQLASNNPTSLTINRGSQGINVMAFNLGNPSGEKVSLTSLRLVCQGCGGAVEFSEVRLYRAGSLIGTAKPTPGNPFIDFDLTGSPLELAVVSISNFTVQLDLIPTAIQQYAQNFYIELRSVSVGTGSSDYSVGGLPLYSSTHKVQ